MPMKRIALLLAEDHAVVREGLRALLALEPDFEVVGEACTGREAVQLAQDLRPEVVIMDIAMPLLNGVEATRQILKELPATKVLILSGHAEDEYVEQAMAIGAMGYLLKQTSAHTLARAIREVWKGGTHLSPSVSRRRRFLEKQAPNRGRVPGKPGIHLTSREVEVVQLIAEGKSNKQSAAELGISIKTVEKHRQSLMSKLDIHDTAGVTRYAISEGIIEGRVDVQID